MHGWQRGPGTKYRLLWLIRDGVEPSVVWQVRLPLTMIHLGGSKAILGVCLQRTGTSVSIVPRLATTSEHKKSEVHRSPVITARYSWQRLSSE